MLQYNILYHLMFQLHFASKSENSGIKFVIELKNFKLGDNT